MSALDIRVIGLLGEKLGNNYVRHIQTKQRWLKTLPFLFHLFVKVHTYQLMLRFRFFYLPLDFLDPHTYLASFLLKHHMHDVGIYLPEFGLICWGVGECV